MVVVVLLLLLFVVCLLGRNGAKYSLDTSQLKRRRSRLKTSARVTYPPLTRLSPSPTDCLVMTNSPDI